MPIIPDFKCFLLVLLLIWPAQLCAQRNQGDTFPLNYPPIREPANRNQRIPPNTADRPEYVDTRRPTYGWTYYPLAERPVEPPGTGEPSGQPGKKPPHLEYVTNTPLPRQIGPGRPDRLLIPNYPRRVVNATMPRPIGNFSTTPRRPVDLSGPSRFEETPLPDRAGTLNFPIRNDDREILDYNSLPLGFKKAFMTVDELLHNRALINPPGSNYRNTASVFDSETQELINAALEPQVSTILPRIAPGTWRAMTVIAGCCPILRYLAINDTLNNIYGQEKKIVHFNKYNPPMYQFIAHGFCAAETYSTNGHCHQGTTAVNLLVYDFARKSLPISFDVFEIPSYCHCLHY